MRRLGLGNSGPDTRRSTFVGYVVATALILALTAIKAHLIPLLPDSYFRVPDLLAVGLIGYLYGRRSGVLALVLSILAYFYLYLPPKLSISASSATTGDWVEFGLMVAGEIVAVWAMSGLRESRHRIEERSRQLETEVRERVLTEKALRESEAQLRAVLDNISEGIIVSDLDGLLIHWNRAALNMHGYSDIDECRRMLPDFADTFELATLDGVVLPVEEWPVARVLRDEHLRDFEVRIRRLDTGVERIYSYGGAVVRDSAGEPMLALVTASDVTERKQAEEALRESEERFRATYEQAAVGIELLDIDQGRLLQGNRVLARMLGYDEKELEARTFAEITHPDDLPAEMTLLRRLIDGQIPSYSIEKRYVHKDGQPVWVRVTSSLARTSHPYRISIVEDITEQKQAQEALRESEDRFRTMVEVIPQLAWMAQPDGYIFWYNRRWYEYTGTTPEQMEGWGWQSVHDPQMLPKVMERWKASIATGEPFEMEFPLKGSDGRFRWFLTRVAPLKDSQGRVVRWLGTNTDISEKREAEEAIRQLNAELEQRVVERTSQLQETIGRLNVAYEQEQAARADAASSEARIRQFLEMAPDGIIIATESGCVTFANNQAAAMFGYKRDEIEGKQVEELVPTRYHDIHLRHRGDYAAEPRTRSMGIGMDLYGLRSDGTEFPVEISLSPNRTDGELTVTAIIRDITERKQAEERIRSLNEELTKRAADLEAANKELEAFSYSVSHDLRAPLRAIDGFSNTLLKNYRDSVDERGQDYLQRVRAAAQKMGQLIDDILGLSRATRAEMHREPVDLSALTTEIITDLRSIQPQREADVHIEPDIKVDADPHLLRIALNNLLGNAWKFTSTRDTACIEVGSIVQDAERVYFVRDNGVGFSLTYADKLFSPFQRLHSESEFPGTGIGLALVQRILRRHGGRIWAESVEGQGATFYFTLGEASK